jgi:hypothetical protein
MNARLLLRPVLAFLVSAGLVLAPLATPAMAQHSMAPSMMQMAHGTDMADVSDMANMAADMPCCPDKQQTGGDCQDCPFVAICLLKVWQAEPAASVPVRRQLMHERLRPFDDVIAEGLARPPPDHPPRFLV